MSMMEDDWECKNCKDHAVHMCNSLDAIKKEWGVKDCPDCGTKNIHVRHICKGRIQHLTHLCANCGEVSDDPEKLCNPVLIEESKMAKWKTIPATGKKVPTCNGCHQPVNGAGHICDPKLPYECQFCGEKITETHHMCQEIIKQAKYFCNLCGRLAVGKDDICAGYELK